MLHGDDLEVFFTGAALDFWAAAVPECVTRAEVDALCALAGIRRGTRVLDAPCGLGRHSLALAALGAEVTGVDITGQAIAAARRDARRRGLAVRFLRADARAVHVRDADVAVCLGNSLGYGGFDDAAAMAAALAGSLRHGGRLVLELGATVECAPPAAPSEDRHTAGAVTMELRHRWDVMAGARVTAFRFLRDGEPPVTRILSQWTPTAGELVRLLAVNGVRTTALHGGWAGEPYVPGAQRLVLVGVRT
ncbi:MAG: methyltransferase domain-containing protein [Thermoleophilia bacterium]